MAGQADDVEGKSKFSFSPQANFAPVGTPAGRDTLRSRQSICTTDNRTSRSIEAAAELKGGTAKSGLPQ
jgi:hypothetical protein